MHKTLAVLVLALAAGCGSNSPVPAGDYDKAGSAVNPVRPEGYVPPLDPNRKVSEQDCSRPVDIAAGNLMCK